MRITQRGRVTLSRPEGGYLQPTETRILMFQRSMLKLIYSAAGLIPLYHSDWDHSNDPKHDKEIQTNIIIHIIICNFTLLHIIKQTYYSETSNRYHMFSLQQSIQWTKSCKRSPASSRESFLLSFLTVSVVSR